MKRWQDHNIMAV